MLYERLIAQRYLRSKRQLRFINIIMMVSIIGITVGVAALIIVLSVFNGFNSVVTNVLVAFDPHIRVEPAKGTSMVLDDSLVTLLQSDPQIAGWSPFIASKALLLGSDLSRVVYVRGVIDSTIDKVSGVKESIVLGEFTFENDPVLPGIVLGLSLADRLGATVGTEVTVVSPVGVDAMMLQFGQPLMKKFRVAGIYDSNNKDYDAHYAFVAIDAARTLFQYRNTFSGIEMRLRSIDEAEEFKVALEERLHGRFVVSSWYDLHRDLYSVMQIERWAAYVILCLIVGVATFNVLGSLTMGVIEKRRDIGILKALGATNGSIARLFMFEGVLVGTLGTVIGIILGLGVCLAQIHFQLFPLDPTVYIIPAIPVEIRWGDFISVSAASMLLSSLASLYPAMRAARMLPVSSLRWE
ncbi:MAG: FtsX-like permease family protein [Bacteroidota bacterium]